MAEKSEYTLKNNHLIPKRERERELIPYKTLHPHQATLAKILVDKLSCLLR